MNEHALQVAVAHMLQIVLDPERTWWSAIDHAAKLSPRYGADRKRRGVRAGMPDFIVMWKKPTDLFSSLIGIEMKVGKGRLSPPQIETAAAWSKMDHNIHVARSLEEVQEILEHCRIPLRRRMVRHPNAPIYKLPGGGYAHDFGPGLETSGHRRSRRPRKSKNHLPLVLARAAQKE